MSDQTNINANEPGTPDENTGQANKSGCMTVLKYIIIIYLCCSLFSYVNLEVPFDSFNIELTGIDDFTVADAPTFSELWETIKPWMESGVLVAHNAVFDLSVLKACLTAYNITWKKSVRYLCTVQAGRKLLPGMKHNLNILCDYYGIPLDHHKADSDSRACAEILLRYIADGANER